VLEKELQVLQERNAIIGKQMQGAKTNERKITLQMQKNEERIHANKGAIKSIECQMQNPTLQAAEFIPPIYPLNETDQFFSDVFHIHFPVIIAQLTNSSGFSKYHDLDNYLRDFKNNTEAKKYRPASLMTNHQPIPFSLSTNYFVFKGEECDHIAGGAPYDLWNSCEKADLDEVRNCILKVSKWPPSVKRAIKLKARPTDYIILCDEDNSSEKCLNEMKHLWQTYKWRELPLNELDIKDKRRNYKTRNVQRDINVQNQLQVKCSGKQLVGCSFDLNSSCERNFCLGAKTLFPSIKLFNTFPYDVFTFESRGFATIQTKN